MHLMKFFSLAIIFVMGLAVAGCMERTATLWNQSNETEGEGFGDASYRVFAQQIENPDAAKPNAEDAAMDGTRVILAVGEYKKGPVKDSGEGDGFNTSVKNGK